MNVIDGDTVGAWRGFGSSGNFLVIIVEQVGFESRVFRSGKPTVSGQNLLQIIGQTRRRIGQN